MVVMTMSGLFLRTQVIRCQEVNLVLLALSNFVQATPMGGVVVIERGVCEWNSNKEKEGALG